MDRNNQIWSGKRIVSLCLILCLTFSSCLTYVSSTSAYAAEAVESDTAGAATEAGDTEQTVDAGTGSADQNIQAGTSSSDSTAANGSATDGSTDGKDTGAGTESDSAGGSGSVSGSDSSAADGTGAVTGAEEETTLPANVLRADNEAQRGEQLKAQMQLQLQVGLRSGALRTALLTKAGEADEVEVSTPVAAELTREADFPEGTKASLYVYEKEELEEVQASLDQYLTQFDVEVETETEVQEDTAYTSAGSAGSESADAEGSSAESGSTTESLELSLDQLEAAEDAETDSTGMNHKATDTDPDEANSESTEDEQETQAQTRQVLRTKVETVYLPLDLSIVDANGDKLSETGSMTIRLTLGDEELLRELKEAWQEENLILYHLKHAGTEQEAWEALSFTIQEKTEETDGYLQFTAESLSPFLFVQTEQVVVEVTADQTDADTEDASKAAEGEDSESENASDTDANAESESEEEAGEKEEEKVYPYFTSGLWGVKDGYEPIWEESDCLDFSRADFVSGKDSIPVRFHTYLKGNPYAPEEAGGEASDTESSDETTASASSDSQSAAAQSTDSTDLTETLGVAEEESESTKTTTLSSDLKETIAYTLTDDTFYLEGEKLSDADYDIKGIEWIFGTASSKATTGAESDAQAVALTESSDEGLELWVGSSDRQTVTIWVRVGAKSITSATTDTDGDDNNTENTEASDNLTENAKTALDEAIGGNEIDTAETDADTEATTWKVAAIYDLTTETYLSVDEDLLTAIDGKNVSFADGVKGVRLTTKNKDAETYLGMYVDANLYPTANVLNEIENVAEISLTNQTEANASKNSSSLFQKINKTTVWLQDEEAQVVQTDAAAEVQAIAQTVTGGYTVTFEAGSNHTFVTNESTNILKYNAAGRKIYGVYYEPKDSSATFDGWYDATVDGNKYEIDIDGNLSPAPTSDIRLYARYIESNKRYAVSIYGIGVDVLKSGSAGLTFGPASGANGYLEEDGSGSGHVEHTPVGSTKSGNLHRCIHNDSWSTIVAWNEEDPYVYEECIATGCTHAVLLSQNNTEILNDSFTANINGDGVGALVFELNGSNTYQDAPQLSWNTTQTTDGGYGESQVRAMLNGATVTNSTVYGYRTDNCLLATFPEELRNAIGEREIRYDSVVGESQEENLKIVYDKLWLFSTNELAEDCSELENSHPLEGTVYDKLRGTATGTEEKRIVHHSRGGTELSSACYMWTRSLCENGTVYYIWSDGEVRTNGAESLYGISPGFTLARNAKTTTGTYEVTFDGNGKTFVGLGATNTLRYRANGEKVYGVYYEPADSTVTFDGWYDDADPEQGNKYSVDVDGNLSPAPTGDITLYAHYNDASIKYAVSIYGIGVDTLTSGEAGLTFGPALGGDYIVVSDSNDGYVSHDPTAAEYQDENGEPLKTDAGNEHRCIHNDSWSTIVAWNEKDPYVYEQCLKEGCTHSVTINENETSTIVNTSFDKVISGDGTALLWRELQVPLWSIGNTTVGGWGESTARAMLNGISIPGDSTYNYSSTNCLLATFPKELQNAIGEREVRYDSVAGELTEENLKIVYDKLWYFSTNELIDDGSGLGDYNHPLEGTVYPKWEGTDAYELGSRAGYHMSDNRGSLPGRMWTRSIYDENQVHQNIFGYFVTVEGNIALRDSANISGGAALGFTLARSVKAYETSYQITYHANGQKFPGGSETNVVKYDAAGERVYGVYYEPADSTVTFDGWYDDADPEKGNKYGVDTDGNLSPAPTGDIILYAHYNDASIKYAVSIYGIGVDTLASGEAGLTFGPALGADYITVSDDNLGYKSHQASGVTEDGNAHRCLHTDSWSTIIAWNEKDPYVYEQCLEEGCTHSVPISENDTSTVVNTSFDKTIPGDGTALLWRELQNTKWSLDNTTEGGWGESTARAMLNGLSIPGDSTWNYSSTNCLLATFPKELQSAIGEREVRYDSVAGELNEENLKITYDKLWYFSTNELVDDDSGLGVYGHPLEGTVYPKWEGTDAFTLLSRAGYHMSDNYGSLHGRQATRSIYDENIILTNMAGRFAKDGGDIDVAWANSSGNGLSPGFTLTTSYKKKQTTANLSVKNVVQGNMGNKVKEFEYEMVLKTIPGVIVTDDLVCEKMDSDGNVLETLTLSAANGTYAFALAHGESICFRNIPKGYSYVINEKAGLSDYTISCTNSSDTLWVDTTVTFTNTRNSTVPTLAVTGIGALLGLGLAAFVLLTVVRRKRNNLDLQSYK